MMQAVDHMSRRTFAKTAAASLAAMSLPFRARAAGSDRIRIGLIGCGNRGGGAVANCFEADDGVQLLAIADAYAKGERFARGMQHIREWCDKNGRSYDERVKVSPETIFTGFGGYKQLLAMDDIDLVLIATPANFHPLHLAAAIDAGKHVFVEKPAAVDPPGARSVIDSGERARQKGLSIVAGTQRRHQASYRQNAYAVQHGAVGRLFGGRVWWCGGGASTPPQRLAGQDDAEYMVRNWYRFSQMSGDHIIEQHVHNLDVANWFIGRPPALALGFGGRARRQGGNQYDFFSIDFDYGEDVTVHSMCRQINDCYTRVSEHFVGVEGSLWGDGKRDGKAILVPEYEEKGGPYVQEHRDLIASIRAGEPINEARAVAESTLTAIMGRISAYTGQLVRWIDLSENAASPWYDLRMQPTAIDFERGPVTAPEENVLPLPGKA
ncbi:Gfo/Idh/MocA family oxidoreductase, partial [candidate division KSB1 bacterium]